MTISHVLKPGGTLILIAEVYRGANSTAAKLAEKYVELTGMAILSAPEHGELVANAGYTNVQVIEDHKGWICGTGRKP